MKRLFFLLGIVLGSVVIMSCQDPLPAKPLAKEEFKERIASLDTLQLIDVRTPEEFGEGHINHAQNVDYFKEDAFKTYFENYDREKPLFLYCRSGNRSQKAALILKEMGFENLFDLEGGYTVWNDKEN